MLGNLNRLKCEISPRVGTYVSEAQSLQISPDPSSSPQQQRAALPPALDPARLSPQSQARLGTSLNRPWELRVPAGPPCPGAQGEGCEHHTSNPFAFPPHPHFCLGPKHGREPGNRGARPSLTLWPW